jgi:hypothetical protein
MDLEFKCESCDKSQKVVVDQEIIAFSRTLPNFKLEWSCSSCKHANASSLPDGPEPPVRLGQVSVGIPPPAYEEAEMPEYMKKPEEGKKDNADNNIVIVVECPSCKTKQDLRLEPKVVERALNNIEKVPWICRKCNLSSTYPLSEAGELQSPSKVNQVQQKDLEAQAAPAPAAVSAKEKTSKLTFEDIINPSIWYCVPYAWQTAETLSSEDGWKTLFIAITFILFPIPLVGDILSPILGAFLFPFVYIFGCCCDVNPMKLWGIALSIPRTLIFVIYIAAFAAVCGSLVAVLGLVCVVFFIAFQILKGLCSSDGNHGSRGGDCCCCCCCEICGECCSSCNCDCSCDCGGCDCNCS